ncbi:hypothetical protein FJ364_04605, partial [Candidatus Dependentiae bacterium]|nr:hypothetical protein [Candidatus Dependentiae bacterium]
MKLKLLLCYVLLVCSNCVFIVADDSEDTIEDDDAPELVASPIQAMGSVPHKITKKMITKNAAAQRAEIASSDPYAKVQSEPSRIIVSSGDPYAKSFSGTDKTSSIQGDPYATIGSTQLVETKKSSGKEIQDYKKRDDLKKLTPPDSFTSMLFGSFSNGNNPFGSDAQAVVKAIDKEVKLKEKELKSVAEERLASVTKEISVEAAKLRKEADAAARSIKERTEGSVQALLKTAEARIDSLNKEVVSESIKLKQKAAEKALTVLDEMEQRAALRRAEERKRALAATFGLKEEVLLQKEPKRQQKADFIVQKDETSQSVVPDLITKKPNDSTSTVIDTSSAAHQPMLRVSAEWKNDLSRRFYQDMTAMKNIILEAESPAEAQDFLKKFEEQNKWFDLTLRSTRLVSDTQYAQLIAKQSQLDKLMQAQQSADDYLEKLTKNMVIDRSQMKKMRLGLL